jgi:hypothetical protein
MDSDDGLMLNITEFKHDEFAALIPDKRSRNKVSLMTAQKIDRLKTLLLVNYGFCSGKKESKRGERIALLTTSPSIKIARKNRWIK